MENKEHFWPFMLGGFVQYGIMLIIINEVLLTFNAHGYCSCVSVCLSVCLWSVKSHLTSGVCFRPENTFTYSAGNGGQKICGIFSKTAPLQRSSTPFVERPYVQSAIFLPKVCMRIIRESVDSLCRDGADTTRPLFKTEWLRTPKRGSYKLF